ncbi:bombyxin A-3 homolog [Pectinophora gossypiella]|uniref:bombyxin A-3 homolog n=1 Tax=Pectinophora gossypiella TaxID=13191 RepID=UPI00214DF1C4|nr:bombyxin A-3 homolog [Pectinophora gossypiella]
MKVQRVFIIIAFLAVMASVTKSEDNAHIYCGRNLAITLAMLCENGMMVKRAESYNALVPHAGWMWMPPQRARALARGKRQIASECCDKACTEDELLTYCAN